MAQLHIIEVEGVSAYKNTRAYQRNEVLIIPNDICSFLPTPLPVHVIRIILPDCVMILKYSEEYILAATGL
jgi:adenylate kinase